MILSFVGTAGLAMDRDTLLKEGTSNFMQCLEKKDIPGAIAIAKNPPSDFNLNYRDPHTGMRILSQAVIYVSRKRNANQKWIQSGNELFTELINQGALVDGKNESTKWPTALFITCYYGKHKHAKFLLDNNANPDAQNSYGETPLHTVCASRLRDEKTILTLLKNGADHDIENRFGQKPEISTDLIEQANPFNRLNNAIAAKNFEEATSIIDKCHNQINFDTENNEGWPVLHHALNCIEKKNDVSAIKLVTSLIKYGAEVNQQTKNDREAPLHSAAYFDNSVMVKLLLKNRADPNRLNKMRQSPLSSAFSSIFMPEKIIPILSHITSLNQKDVDDISVKSKIKFGNHWGKPNKGLPL